MTYANTTAPGQAKRYLVLLDKHRIDDGLQAIRQRADIEDGMRVANTANVPGGFLNDEQFGQSDIVILDRLGVALLNEPLTPPQEGALIAAVEDTRVPILAVAEEETWHAIEDPTNLSRQYLEGYRDGVNQLIDKLLPTQQQTEATATAVNESADTWVLQITKVTQSPHSGSGIRVAVLDTGLDLNHPDFIGRKLVSKSFIIGVATAQDGNGHGTHCIGTACGPRRPSILPRYGVAYESEIYAGKVLGDDGSGSSFNIVDGINWAITNNCAVISLSLGSSVSRGERYSNFYEQVGDRALDEGTLIVAAAGNESQRPRLIAPVGAPANCPSFMAVAAVDARLQIAWFSCGGINPNGGQVDIAAPGVNIYSSYPLPTRYERLNGTSMATPHVAGIAALYAQATGKQGRDLWNLLTRHARRLSLPSRDVGIGLVQALSR